MHYIRSCDGRDTYQWILPLIVITERLYLGGPLSPNYGAGIIRQIMICRGHFQSLRAPSVAASITQRPEALQSPSLELSMHAKPDVQR